MSVITGQGVTAYPLPDEELSPTSKNAVSNEAVCEGLDEIKSALDALVDGYTEEYDGYYDETYPSGIGGNIYKSNVIKVDAYVNIDSVSCYSKDLSFSKDLLLFVLDDNNVIVDKITLTPTSIGWNTFTINKSYSVDVYFALSSGSIGFSYATVEKENYYSDGLYEASASDRTKTEGESITFTQNVPGRYYEFGFSVEVSYIPLGERVSDNTRRIEALENPVNKLKLTDFTMPQFKNTGVEGYTLVGKWCSFSSYDECVNTAGGSIMFKVRGATSVSVDIKEIVHPSHPDWTMAVAPYIAYSVDGGAFTRQQIGSSPISISIPDTFEHFVWIVVDGVCLYSGSANRNSGWSGVYINDISSDGHIYKIEPLGREILFVGDSIVEGINTLGTTSTSDVNSAINEFGFRTARKLDAIPVFQGYGGSTTLNGLKFERYSWVDAQQNDYNVYNKVDAILIEYGFNDASAGYSTDTFKGYYRDLIDLLVGHYGGVPVFCMIPFKQSFAQAIRELAAERSYCYCIETSDYDVTYSDSSHPNAAGAEEIAKRLSADIMTYLPEDYFLGY